MSARPITVRLLSTAALCTLLMSGATGCASQPDAGADNPASSQSAAPQSDAHPQSDPASASQSTPDPDSATPDGAAENPSDKGQSLNSPAQGASSAQNGASTPSTEAADYENEYFTLDVPDDWEGAWEVTQRDMNISGINLTTYVVSVDYHRINPNFDGGGMDAIAVLTPEQTRQIPESVHLGTTSGGLEVRVVMAAGGTVIGNTDHTAHVTPK